MRKKHLVFPLIAVSLPVVWIIASASHHQVLTLDTRTREFVPKTVEPDSTETLPPPKVEIKELTHDFGVMNPNDVSSYKFVIKNSGEGPLQLKKGGTSCKCTEFKILNPVIEPGEEGYVEVEWETVFERGPFNETATIRTNDPEQKSFKLAIHGRITRMIATEPLDGAVFSRLLPDQVGETSVILYSQEWQAFDIEEITCQFPGLVWEIKEADKAKLEQLKAKSGFLVSFTTPKDLASDTHHHKLRFQVRPGSDNFVEERAEPVVHEVDAYAEVAGRLSVKGLPIKTTVDGRGVVEFGTVDSGESKRAHLIIKVNDKEPEIKVREVKTDPQFVKAWIEPFNKETKPDLYHLFVEIPSDAPVCYYNGIRNGHLKLLIDHPRISKLDLDLTFAVVDDGS